MASLMEEQILEREMYDDELFESSFIKIAGAVMGHEFGQSLMDNRHEAKDAMDKVLKYFHLSSVNVPDTIQDPKEQLDYICRCRGLMYRKVKLKEKWHKDAVGPMLGVIRTGNKPVALIPNEFSGYTYWNIETGMKQAVRPETENMFLEDAICFYVPFPAKKLSLKELAVYIIQRIPRKDILWLMVMMALATLVGLILPRLNKILTSSVVDSGSVRMLLGITIFMVCQKVSETMFKTLQKGFMIKIQQKLNIDVQAAATMRLLTLPAKFFSEYGSGDLHTRIGKLPRLCDTIVSMVLSTGISSIFSLIYITQIGTFAPRLMVPALFVIGLTTVVTIASSLVQARLTKTQLGLEAKENAMSYAMITGMQKIRLAGAERRFFGRWAELYSKNAYYLYNPPLFLKLNKTINLAVTLFGTVWLYSAAIKAGMTMSEYFAFNSAYAMVLGAFSGFADVALEAAKIKPMMEMAEPILNTVPETGETKLVLEKLSGGIELNNVCFRYNEDGPWIANGISLNIRPNDYVAIVGKTGCGKSTLVRLLLGLEKPERGAIYYDGHDLNELDLRSIRQRIGTVMQNGAMFIGSILENIKVNAPGITEEEVWETAEIAGIADDIRRMPMGLQTLIAEGSGGFSGGQKQRLLIARALASKPKILIFDEATSALDNVTQKQITEALDKLRCTRIVIAHRLSTIRSCNRIIFLDGGKIVEDGSYDELMEKQGMFFDLVKRQQA